LNRARPPRISCRPTYRHALTILTPAITKISSQRIVSRATPTLIIASRTSAFYSSATTLRQNALMRVKQILALAAVLGAAGGYAWSVMPPATAEPASVGAPAQTTEQIEHSVYYARCADARDAGKAPIYAGQPGYREGLDADGDGVACEPYRGV
jgi:hypothetical protein